MTVSHPIIADKVSEYVKGILVIDDYPKEKPFVLPLFANGTPTLVFQTAKARINNQSNHLTLFGQTVLPTQLFLNETFTLIYFTLHKNVQCYGQRIGI